MNTQNEMKKSKVVPIRYYQIVTVKGEPRVAARVGKKWEFDAQCVSVNDMLEKYYITPEVAKMWATKQNNPLNNT